MAAMSCSSIHHYSIIICGGGLIGKSLALALRSHSVFDHLSIAIIAPNSSKVMESKQEENVINTNTNNNDNINKSSNNNSGNGNGSHYSKRRIYSLNSRSINFITNTLEIPLYKHKEKVKSYNEMLVWQRDEYQSAINFSQPCSMGAIVDGNWLEEEVDKKIAMIKDSSSGIDVINDKIEGFNYDPRWPWIDGKLASGKPFKCTLMIGADGRESIVKKCSGIRDAFRDYKQKAIIGTVKIRKEDEGNNNNNDNNDNDRPIQRFTSYGPIALLPLANDKMALKSNDYYHYRHQHNNSNDNHEIIKEGKDDSSINHLNCKNEKYMSMVWSIPQEMANNLYALKQDNWNVLIDGAINLLDADTRYALQTIKSKVNDISEKITTENIKWRFDNLSKNHLEFNRKNQLPRIEEVIIPSIATIPLYLALPNRIALPNIALIGDAAHTIHPLAGLGLNMGFDDIKTLIESMIPYSKIKMYSGYYDPLREYEQKRRTQVWPLAMGIDKIERIFSIGGDPDKFALKYGSIRFRNMIMKTVESNGWIKRAMMRTAGASLHHQSFTSTITGE